MTLWTKVNALLAGISDPKTRIDIATSINYLYNLFSHGAISEDQLRSDLKEICASVIESSNPLLTEEEAMRRAEAVADDLIRTMKLESIHHRVRVRLRSLFPP
jgi:hypothetical protein